MRAAVNVTGTDLNDAEEDRHACAISVIANEFDFVLGLADYKSSGNRRSKQARVKQALASAAFIRGSTMFEERNVVLIGDYKMYPRRDRRAFAALSPTGFLTFLSTKGLCNAQGLHCTGTHISSGGLAGC